MQINDNVESHSWSIDSPIFRNPSDRFIFSGSCINYLLPGRLEEPSLLLKRLVCGRWTLGGLRGTHAGMDVAHAGDDSTEQFLVFLAHVENALTGHDEVGKVGRNAQACPWH